MTLAIAAAECAYYLDVDKHVAAVDDPEYAAVISFQTLSLHAHFWLGFIAMCINQQA